MQKIIGVTELQRHFRSVFDEVAHNHVPHILTRGSRPEAVMIPYDDFLRYQAWDEQRVTERFERLMARLAERNAGFSDEEIEADVRAAIVEVRSIKANGA